MKNKTFARVLSFCLALILCFTWNIAQPLVANAFALESGWVLYAIISFMVASGITLSAVGGIEALQSAVEDKWDDFTEYKKGKGEIIDLAPYVKYIPPSSPTPNNPNGLTPKFWYGATAFAILFEFIQWLRSELKDNNEITSSEFQYYLTDDITVWVNGVETQVRFPIVDGSSQGYPYFTAGSTTGKDKILEDGTVFYIGDVVTTDFTDTYNCFDFSTADNVIMSHEDGSITNRSFSTAYSDNGYTPSDIIGFTVGSYLGDHALFLPVTSDGYVLFSNWNNSICQFYYGGNVIKKIENSCAITFPETITDHDVKEGECLELDFSQFQSDINSVDTPEEFTEAVKHEIISSGTFPSVQTEIKPDPNIKPNPDPDIPNEPSIDIPTEPSPDQLTDVGELGLPSLGSAMLKKFPFSLPLTFASILQIFSAERQTPKWDIEFPAPLSVSFTIDLSNYEELGTILRVTTTIGYCLGLILATRKFISW